MKIRDEFEFTNQAGETFYVNVEGKQIVMEGKLFNDIQKIEITQENGENITSDDDCYAEILEECLYRDYELEEHSSDFNFYDENLENYYHKMGDIG